MCLTSTRFSAKTEKKKKKHIEFIPLKRKHSPCWAQNDCGNTKRQYSLQVCEVVKMKNMQRSSSKQFLMTQI